MALPDVPPVQVFGLQRSGTNYLHWLVGRNLRIQVTKDAGWKHGFPHERRIGLHGATPLQVPIVENAARLGIQIVVVRKDLDHWLESIARDPKDYDRGDPERAWHAFYGAWRQFAPIVRYEDFLGDFRQSMDHLGSIFGVSPRSYRQPTKVPNSPRWSPEKRTRYV